MKHKQSLNPFNAGVPFGAGMDQHTINNFLSVRRMKMNATDNGPARCNGRYSLLFKGALYSDRLSTIQSRQSCFFDHFFSHGVIREDGRWDTTNHGPS
jgi:hypothetical protein